MLGAKSTLWYHSLPPISKGELRSHHSPTSPAKTQPLGPRLECFHVAKQGSGGAIQKRKKGRVIYARMSLWEKTEGSGWYTMSVHVSSFVYQLFNLFKKTSVSQPSHGIRTSDLWLTVRKTGSKHVQTGWIRLWKFRGNPNQFDRENHGTASEDVPLNQSIYKLWESLDISTKQS